MSKENRDKQIKMVKTLFDKVVSYIKLEVDADNMHDCFWDIRNKYFMDIRSSELDEECRKKYLLLSNLTGLFD